MRKLALGLAVVGLLAFANGAMATAVISGGATTGDSWTQEFYENGLYGPTNTTQYSFDSVALQMVVGQLGVPPDTGISATGWTYNGTASSGVLTLNAPPPVTSLYNYITFQGTPSESLAFHWQIYLHGVREGSEFLQYNGATGGWTYIAPDPTAGSAVPEPISMIFFGTGLVAVGGYVARRRMLRNA